MFVTTLVLSCLLAALFLFSGARKVAGGESVVTEAAHLGVPIGWYRTIGVAEAAGTAGLLIGLVWAPLGIAAAAALAALMLGAVVTHLRVNDPVAQWTPAAVIAVLSAAALILRIASA
jgi:uncharacterized membrane protein YphA (DoxX/SURF4 family)